VFFCWHYGMIVWVDMFELESTSSCYENLQPVLHWRLKVPARREHVSGTWGLSACELIEAVTLRSTTCQQRLLEISGIEILLESMKILDLYHDYITLYHYNDTCPWFLSIYLSTYLSIYLRNCLKSETQALLIEVFENADAKNASNLCKSLLWRAQKSFTPLQLKVSKRLQMLRIHRCLFTKETSSR
jgi:hypothetical protein